MDNGIGDVIVGAFIFIVLVVLILFGAVSILNWVWNDYEQGRQDLAKQVASGTYEIVWSTNDFGSLEVRIEAKENGDE